MSEHAASLTRLHQLVERQLPQHAEAVALFDIDGSAWSFDALQRAAEAGVLQLRERGVGAGDRILLVSENCVAAVVYLLAASRLDAWAIPVNARMSELEIDRICTHSDPRLMIFTSAVSVEAAEHGVRLGAEHVPASFGSVSMRSNDQAVAEPLSATAQQVAVVLYTTGTTGDPKGVMLSHHNLLFAGRVSAELRELQRGDVIFGALPLSHVFGLASMIVAALYAGSAVRLQTRYQPAALFAALGDDVTVLPAVPQMHALLMQHTRENGQQQLSGSKLRYVSSGAAPLDPAWKREAEVFYGLPLQNGYGMTECSAGICCTLSEAGDPDTSVGLPLPGVDVRIDQPSDDGGVGEILVRGGNVMLGYYNNPTETAAVLSADGWLRTGDLGRFDEAGRLHIVGRQKELIIRSGFNVFPQEVERALNDHPQVVQSAVMGRPRAGNEEVLAFVQVQHGSSVSEAELAAFVSERLSAYKRPAQIVLCGSLPATATGKILKNKLLHDHADRLRQEG